jgi:hypothetical protein
MGDEEAPETVENISIDAFQFVETVSPQITDESAAMGSK